MPVLDIIRFKGDDMFKFREITVDRAIDIITSANPNFPCYYVVVEDANRTIIKFWISDNPYYKYIIRTNYCFANDLIRILKIKRCKEV